MHKVYDENNPDITAEVACQGLLLTNFKLGFLPVNPKEHSWI